MTNCVQGLFCFNAHILLLVVLKRVSVVLGIELDKLYARQAPYLLYYLSNSVFNIIMVIHI